MINLQAQKQIRTEIQHGQKIRAGKKKITKFGQTGKDIKIVDYQNRKNIFVGLHVAIVLKQDQRSNKFTDGIVEEILTNSPSHPHGIKVRIESGEIGRVKEIYE